MPCNIAINKIRKNKQAHQSINSFILNLIVLSQSEIADGDPVCY